MPTKVPKARANIMNTSTSTTEVKNSNYQQNRATLRELSIALRPAVKAGAYATINEALIDAYSKDGHTEFKTFNQWKSEGKSIIKGSKAFVVWAKPKDIPHPDPEAEQDEFSYYPLCYLFSNKQVTESKTKLN